MTCNDECILFSAAGLVFTPRRACVGDSKFKNQLLLKHFSDIHKMLGQVRTFVRFCDYIETCDVVHGWPGT